MFSAGSLVLIAIIAFFLAIFSVLQSLGFYIFTITSVLTFKVFFKSFQEFKNGVTYFITPRIIEIFRNKSDQDLPGETSFMVWFLLNFIVALVANHFFGWE